MLFYFKIIILTALSIISMSCAKKNLQELTLATNYGDLPSQISTDLF